MNDGSLKDLSFSNLLPTAHISPKSKLINDDGRWHFHQTDSPVVSEANDESFCLLPVNIMDNVIARVMPVGWLVRMAMSVSVPSIIPIVPTQVTMTNRILSVVVHIGTDRKHVATDTSP